MTIGSTMPIVTTMEAGAIIAAAVHPGAPGRAEGAATATMIDLPRPACRAQPLNVLSHHSFSAASFFAR